MKKEVKIMGAGPAGLAAAINLAKAGYSVKVFEKNKSCGERFNGDFQGLENWTENIDVIEDLKAMNIDPAFIHTPFNQLKVYDCDLNNKVIESKKPLFYLVRRGDFKDTLDYSLMKQAINLGVKINFSTAVKEQDCDIVSKGPAGADIIAKGITFETNMKDTVVGILDDDIAPKGYAYLIVNGGKGCFVTVLFRHFHKEAECYALLRKKFDKILNLDVRNEKEFGGYGCFFLEQNYKYNNRLHVGEAAGLQDFLFGFGMRYALTSGYLAAHSIINNEDFETLMRKRFNVQMETAILNRFAFEKLGNPGYKLLVKGVSSVKEPLDFVHWLYNGSIARRFFVPIAEIAMKSNVNLHKECGCIWCRSKEQEIN